MAKYIYKNAGYVASNLVRRYCSFVKSGENETYGGLGALIGAGLGGGLGYFLNSASKNRWLSALAGAGVGGAAGYGIGRNIPVKPVATSPKATTTASGGTREVDAPPELVAADPSLDGKKVMVRPGPSRPIAGKPVNNGSPVATTAVKPVPRKKTHMIPPPIRPYTLKLVNPKTNQVESVVLDPASVAYYNKLDPTILQNPDANFRLIPTHDSEGNEIAVPRLNLESPSLRSFTPETFASVIAKGKATGVVPFLYNYRKDYSPELNTVIPIQQVKRTDPATGREYYTYNTNDLAAQEVITLLHLYANAAKTSPEFVPYSRFVNTKAYTPEDIDFLRQNGMDIYDMLTLGYEGTKPRLMAQNVYDRWKAMLERY